MRKPARRITLIIALALAAFGLQAGADGRLEWISPNNYRVLLEVDPRGVERSNSPASVDVDLQAALRDAGAVGTFDENTVEVVGYDDAGKPRVFSPSRDGYEKHLLPWRADDYYGMDGITLRFVMPDHNCTRYAVYFDTVESGLGRPKRYRGLVGDGDYFREDYERREINACHFGDFCDFDGDGDLDLFKAGVEPYIHCYENVGNNKMVYRGRLANKGELFTLHYGKQRRSWMTIDFCDWDLDGDMDLFPSFGTGFTSANTNGQTWVFENTTVPGGPLTFEDRGPMATVSGKPLGIKGTFAGVTFADLDGDGKRDILLARHALLEFHKNVGPPSDISDMKFADGEYIKANGVEVQVSTARFDCADIDSDGDLDLFCGSQHGHIHWFENLGDKTNPVFGTGRMIVFHEFLDAHSGVTIADFDDDGLLDMIVGRYWERTSWDHQPRFYGRLYKNTGTPNEPYFTPVDAHHGAPYTEQFQICDAVRQNRVRAVDWDSDGKMDLIASDTDGFMRYFGNTTDQLFPVFAQGKKMTSGGKPIRRTGNCAWIGYAKCDVADWNNDGKNDLLVLDSTGLVALYLNEGTDSNPKPGAPVDLMAGDKPVRIPGIAGGILVCDWNNDGKKDLVMSDGGYFYFLKNTNTDADPVLATPKRVLFGPEDDGETAHWTRPSPGGYLDWDGDGKKDFIAGEFEHYVRFFKNIGAGGPGDEPQFADSRGTVIVQPDVGMLISGADTKDWNGDGDIDILSGQGHGGGGLRFFERDYIEDFVNDTFPIVTAGKAEHKP